MQINSQEIRKFRFLLLSLAKIRAHNGTKTAESSHNNKNKRKKHESAIRAIFAYVLSFEREEELKTTEKIPFKLREKNHIKLVFGLWRNLEPTFQSFFTSK